MTIEEIIKLNYAATVKRGLITPETTKSDFVEKLKEEVREFEFEIDNPFFDETKPQEIELADVILVCLAYAEHFKIDILKVMAEKANYNMKR